MSTYGVYPPPLSSKPELEPGRTRASNYREHSTDGVGRTTHAVLGGGFLHRGSIRSAPTGRPSNSAKAATIDV